MEYKKFIEELQRRLGKNRKEVESSVSDMLQIVKERSVLMDSFSIQGFGTFEPRKKAERISVNPSTGKRMLIPPKIVLTFKPGTIIKNKLREKSDNEQ
ncbi:MAG: HU family DNA-binding protein [Coprobacter sp.]|nr:HU family DNA-binding protein [Coprobacter sp.]